MREYRQKQKSAEEFLRKGYQLHQQGRQDLATVAYKEVLKYQPRNFDALHLLGIVALQMQDIPNAVAWISKAVAIHPEDIQAHSNLGVALQAAGRPLDALANFERAVQLQPAYAEGHYNRGKILRELNRLEESLKSYDAAIKAKPDYLEALNNRSEVLLALHRPQEALSCAEQALQVHPEYPEALSNRGNALLALKQLDAALENLTRALHLKPEMPKARYNRGDVLVALGRHDEALMDYEHAIAMQPDSAEQSRLWANALSNLGHYQEALGHVDRALSMRPAFPEALNQRGLILNGLGRPADALACFDNALSLRPDYTEALNHRGNALMRLNRFLEARADYEKANQISPFDDYTNWNLCLCLLLTSHFDAGWEKYEARWSSVGIGVKPFFHKPQWKGNFVEGTLLIWGEQGLGDQIIYSSMLNEMARWARKLIIAIDHRLHPLYTRSFPSLVITTLEQAIISDEFDIQVAMGNLGQHLRHDTTEFLRHRSAFLQADPVRTEGLRQHLAQQETRICGISWFSNNKSVGQEKSMRLHDLLPVLRMTEFEFVDLQYGDTTAERNALYRDTGIDVIRVPSIDAWNDIDGLAALVNACDIIITISNTTAHIAGALGKTVLLMLPYSQGRFWYWQTERTDTLWYPNVRVFRQSRDGDWDSIIEQVQASLLSLVTTDI